MLTQRHVTPRHQEARDPQAPGGTVRCQCVCGDDSPHGSMARQAHCYHAGCTEGHWYPFPLWEAFLHLYLGGGGVLAGQDIQWPQLQ